MIKKPLEEDEEASEESIPTLEKPGLIGPIEHAMGEDEKSGDGVSLGIKGDEDIKYQEKPNLIDMVRQKQSDGVIAILCETVQDIMVVEKMLTENPEDGLQQFTVYNPKNPHFSHRNIIFNFVRDLQACGSKSQRKSKFLIKLLEMETCKSNKSPLP